MTLKKRPDGTYHTEFQANGRRIHRSTRTKNRREAQAFERELRRSIVRGGLENPPEGPRTPETSLESTRRPGMTLGEAAERYLEHLRAQTRKPTTLSRYESLVERLVIDLGGGAVALASIDTPTVYGLKERLRSRGYAPGTVNRRLDCLRSLLRRAEQEWGVQTARPRVMLEKLAPGRTRSLSLEEEDRLMEAIGEHRWLVDLVQFLLGTGARISEALGLTWSEVDLAKGRVRFLHTKNREHRTVPLSASLVERVRRIALSAPSRGAHVFRRVEPGKSPDLRYPIVNWFFRNGLREAGIEDFRIHDLRHTFASRLVARGVSLYKVSRLLGHKDVRMTQRYAHLAVEDLEDAVSLLDVPPTAATPEVAVR